MARYSLISSVYSENTIIPHPENDKSMKRLLFNILRYTGIPELLRETIQKNSVSILTFHDPEIETFEFAANYLCKYYNVISLESYIHFLEGKTEIPPKSIIITMDDGHRNNYYLLPIIKKYKVPVTIFLCSEIAGTNRHFWWKHQANGHSLSELKKMPELERRDIYRGQGFDYLADYGSENRQALNMNEIEEMLKSGYVDFQSHTMYHVLLDKCDDSMSLEEIKKSRTDLQNKLNKPVCAIAYPNGNFGEREILFAKNSGYKCALTTRPGYNKPTTNVYRLLRFGVRDNSGMNEIIVRASGLWGFIKLCDKILQPQKTD
jgi:poly-beta-1,6-N-acetyl-D-glucosamine N-deacetylase